MPIYSYECAACGCMRYMASSMARRDESRSCADCGHELVRRVDSGQGLIGRANPPLGTPAPPATGFASGVSLQNIEINGGGTGVKLVPISGPSRKMPGRPLRKSKVEVLI